MWRGDAGRVYLWRYHSNNIVPDGNMIDKKRLLYAVEMANIRDFVESLPLKYNTKIGNTGQGLSQGQKQRILIARAIYRNPDYLFFRSSVPNASIRTMKK